MVKFVCLRYPKLQMTFKCDIKREINGEIIKEPAVIIQFSDGYYETDDSNKIAFIKRHKDFGVIIHQVDESIQSDKPTPKEEEIINKSRR